MSPIPIGIFAGSGGITLPGNVWTYYSSPLTNYGDVYYDRTFKKWYIVPSQYSGNIYYSTDGSTWTSTRFVDFNGGKFSRTATKLWVTAKYNTGGSAQNTMYYTTDGINFTQTTSPFSNAPGNPADDAYGFTVLNRGANNSGDAYAYSSNEGASWSQGYSTPMDADTSGSGSAGNYAVFWDSTRMYRYANGGLASNLALPSSNIGNYSYLPEDRLLYLWEYFTNQANRMWLFDGTTFTQLGLPLPQSNYFESGISIGIVGESIKPYEFLINWASGYINTDAARVWTPTYGFKYVLSYYPQPGGAAYSPDANMYLTRSNNSNGTYYIMKSVG